MGLNTEVDEMLACPPTIRVVKFIMRSPDAASRVKKQMRSLNPATELSGGTTLWANFPLIEREQACTGPLRRDTCSLHLERERQLRTHHHIEWAPEACSHRDVKQSSPSGSSRRRSRTWSEATQEEHGTSARLSMMR